MQSSLHYLWVDKMSIEKDKLFVDNVHRIKQF